MRKLLQSRMAKLFVLSYIVTLALLVRSWSISGSVPSAIQRFSLDERLAWVSSGAWSSDGSTIFLADPIRGVIETLAVGGNGDFKKFSPPLRQETKSSGKLHYTFIESSSDGFVLEALSDGAPGHFLFFDDEFTEETRSPVRIFDVDRKSSLGPERLYTPYTWTYSEGNFLMFADIKQEVPPWAGGFVTVPTNDPSAFNFFIDMKISAGDKLKNYYRLELGFDSFASDEKNFYALIMDLDPYVVWAKVGEPEKRQIIELNDACGSPYRPAIPEVLDAKSRANALKALDFEEGIFGIHAFADQLYALCKKRVAEGSNFYLTKIDRNTGSQGPPWPIRTKARNLLVIPGAPHWAFVEIRETTDAVEDVPYRKVESLLVVDEGLISAAMAEQSVLPESLAPAAYPYPEWGEILVDAAVVGPVLAGAISAILSFALGLIGARLEKKSKISNEA